MRQKGKGSRTEFTYLIKSNPESTNYFLSTILTRHRNHDGYQEVRDWLLSVSDPSDENYQGGRYYSLVTRDDVDGEWSIDGGGDRISELVEGIDDVERIIRSPRAGKRRKTKKKNRRSYKKKYGGQLSYTHKKFQNRAKEIGKKKAYEKEQERVHNHINKLRKHFNHTIKKHLPKTEAAIEKRKQQKNKFVKLQYERPVISMEEGNKIRRRLEKKTKWRRNLGLLDDSIEEWANTAEEKLLKRKTKELTKKRKKEFQKILKDTTHPEHFNLRKQIIIKKIQKIDPTMCGNQVGCTKRIVKLIGKEDVRGLQLLDELENILEHLKENSSYLKNFREKENN